MLGDLAFQDSNGAYIETIRGAVNLDKLDKEITDTAVDIFVYDTRKDSDGGAWRKRTQHTSWYNETLNTSTRGSRREFPAVTVIVAEATKVTIYDGDDPDLPMWMEFDAGEQTANGKMLQFWGTATTGTVSSVAMLNGVMVVGTNNGSDQGQYIGMTAVNFVSDSAYYRRSFSDQYIVMGNTILDRNVNQYGGYTATGGLVGGNANDVAMTVLPNAPIDPTTGLPIPTIAVATDGGVSVIRDDGTVVDGQQTQAYSVTFRGSDIFGYAGSGVYSYYTGYTADGFAPAKQYWSLSTTTPLITTNNSGDSVTPNAIGMNQSTGGLVLIDHNTTNFDDGMVAYATTSYNTGWQHGAIKGAFLSDTSTTNVTGSDLITNGTFDSDVSSWSGVLATVSHQTNKMRVTNTATNGWAYQAFNVTSGVKYVATVNLTSLGTASNLLWHIRTDSNPDAGTADAFKTTNSTGIHSLTFTASTSTLYVIIRVNGVSGTYLEVDDISVRIAEEDRSVNNNPLQVFGTITKSAVATGADLVGYSGYSSSNYLVQPSIAAPGTGDFSVSGWIKPGSANGTGGNYLHLFSLGTSSTGGQSSSTGFVLKFATYSGANSNGFVPYFYNNDGGTNHGTYDANNYLPLGVWGHIVATRKNGVTYIYLNGELVKIGSAWTTNLTDTYATVFLGLSQTNETGGEADVSLLRYSLSAPSTTQVKKMYEDEKVLFQENVACTLYGSSDAVTALAYDDSTNLLYAGTSSGRSDFQGLRRINNTTTAVTTAISASDELIAEQ